ncbi:midasin-like isoform X2 [Ziziphus jujuba]|uniref:Midasin-like isoform X2 n=1 Tax=Ziziphus jujuba TaxID=326968 RepID=A0ABM4AHF4_ZIZJJ|nr:midasin-like isoform X2 [Ziziphus jujuba]
MKIQLFFSFLFIFHLFIFLLQYFGVFDFLGDLSLHLYGFAYASPFSLFPPQVKTAALCISKGCENCKDGEFFAPTTYKNALRVLHAMQLPEPVEMQHSQF